MGGKLSHGAWISGVWSTNHPVNYCSPSFRGFADYVESKLYELDRIIW